MQVVGLNVGCSNLKLEACCRRAGGAPLARIAPPHALIAENDAGHALEAANSLDNSASRLRISACALCWFAYGVSTT